MYVSDILADIRREPFFYDMLTKTSDQAVIGLVVSDDSDETSNRKIFLANRNPHLTEANFRALAEDKNSHVRYAVAGSKSIPIDVLDLLLTDEIEKVRVQALWNPNSSVQAFRDAVLRGKFSSSSKKGFCHNDKAVRDFEVFDFLWNTVRGSHVLLMNNLNYAVREKHEVIAPQILKVVHDEMRGGNVSKVLKESYAWASIALPEILDNWKDDSARSVINGIARNSSAWVSTHDYLATKYKTAEIHSSIAMVTDSYALLNKIHRGTKNKGIHYWVEKNPVFADGLKDSE
jgi:hypothetical protein